MKAFRISVRILWVVGRPVKRAGAEASSLDLIAPRRRIDVREVVLPHLTESACRNRHVRECADGTSDDHTESNAGPEDDLLPSLTLEVWVFFTGKPWLLVVLAFLQASTDKLSSTGAACDCDWLAL